MAIFQSIIKLKIKNDGEYIYFIPQDDNFNLQDKERLLLYRKISEGLSIGGVYVDTDKIRIKNKAIKRKIEECNYPESCYAFFVGLKIKINLILVCCFVY